MYYYLTIVYEELHHNNQLYNQTHQLVLQPEELSKVHPQNGQQTLNLGYIILLNL